MNTDATQVHDTRIVAAEFGGPATEIADQRRRERVLVASGNQRLLRSYHAHLTQAGFEVITAINGLECLGCFREYLPSILVVDLELRWGGGDGVMTVVREDFVGCIPVIALASGDFDKRLSPWPDVQVLPSCQAQPTALEGMIRQAARLRGKPLSVVSDYS